MAKEQQKESEATTAELADTAAAMAESVSEAVSETAEKVEASDAVAIVEEAAVVEAAVPATPERTLPKGVPTVTDRDAFYEAMAKKHGADTPAYMKAIIQVVPWKAEYHSTGSAAGRGQDSTDRKTKAEYSVFVGGRATRALSRANAAVFAAKYKVTMPKPEKAPEPVADEAKAAPKADAPKRGTRAQAKPDYPKPAATRKRSGRKSS